MGEEAKQEQAKVEAKPEEKTPSPLIIYVNLHCVGCAKKIERSILKIKGVEGVAMDMSQNQVTIKGVVEPQAICTMITKKTNRVVKILSPLPEAEGDPEPLLPEVVASQVSELASVELTVNLHCQACAHQLKKKILQMKGVRTAETELSSGKVRVRGSMDADKLVDYVYRRTRKQAKIIVPQPEPEKPPEEPKPPEEKKEEEKKGAAAAEEEAQKEDDAGKEEEKIEESKEEEEEEEEEERMDKMVFHYHQPLYVIERIPPPQLFSDENPNACCIS